LRWVRGADDPAKRLVARHTKLDGEHPGRVALWRRPARGAGVLSV